LGLFNCDWCYTQGNCGSFGIKGKYDYCKYDVPSPVEKQSAEVKLNALWTSVKQNSTSAASPSPTAILTESVQTSFDRISDVMPYGRKKYIHGVGVVCKVTWKVSSASPFTGLLKSNSNIHGLVRLGSALETDEKSGITPGIGVKLMRSGHASGNFVALNNLNPLPNHNYNFFALPMWNHLPVANSLATIAVAKKFTQASNCPGRVGLSDLCAFDDLGSAVGKSIKFPYKLTLESQHKTSESPATQYELYQRLVKTITPGSVLYSVTASDTPTTSVFLGDMIVDEPCVTSNFGDNGLFFKHQLIEDDWKLEPDFFKVVNGARDCGHSVSTTPPQPQCV
jgi:hypothetical protein